MPSFLFTDIESSTRHWEEQPRLVPFLRGLGKSPDASDELAAVFTTFPPGLEEVDLVRAAQILENRSEP